ncbi:MMPL family transporter [Thalassobacillus sp. CUG 92003]|uniref:MMPL family transporter n=1 Tax=Thalassobacillus sp. CUG 92003 TaxID=2736641 RepID=UPI0015E705F6|nr:MMPL family transporter [Thalassobacillus sp. CUG 92003]
MKKMGQMIVKFHKLFLFTWLVAAVLLGYFAIQLPSLLEGDGFRTDGEFEQVDQTLVEQFNFPESSILVLFEQESGTSDETFETTVDETIQDIEELDVSDRIDSPLNDEEMRNGNSAYAAVHFDEEPSNMPEVIKDIENITSDQSNVTVTGQPVISEDINKASQTDLKNAELIGMPVALIVLVFAFGTLLASLLPMIIAAVTIILGFGILALMGDEIQLSIFILNIAPMIGIALSIDFALLFINRYREEYEKQEKGDALKTTIETAGRSIIFSAVCVFIGLGAMSVIQVDIFMNIAIGGTVVIALAVLSSLTLLPSLLYLIGPRINKWRLIPAAKDATPRWRTFARRVMKRPITITATALALLFIGIIPVTNMNLSIPDVEALPTSYDSRGAFETIQDDLMTNGESTIYVVADRSGDWLNEEGLDKMKDLQDTFADHEHVQSVDTLYNASETETPEELTAALEQPETRQSLEPAIEQFVQDEQLMIPVNLSVEASSDEAQDLAKEWSQKDWDVAMDFGGQPKFNQEIYDEIYDKLGLTLAIIISSTFLILMIAFRSIIIPLKAILMNIIGLASTFGILVWLFQGGHLGLEPSTIALILPVIVFSLVFGLSMDYEVFLISRIHEFYLETGDNSYATVEGLATTSKIITSAALIMIVITGAFAFTGVVPVKQIGIGIAIAILIDATIIRLLLVPSLMKLLGKWNWWFPFRSSRKDKKQPSRAH